MVSQAASGLAWGYKAVSGPRPGCNELQGFGTNMWDLIRGHQDWWLHIRHVYFLVGSCKEGTSTNQYLSQKCDNYRILSYSLSTITFSHAWGLWEALMPLGDASAAPAAARACPN